MSKAITYQIPRSKKAALLILWLFFSVLVGGIVYASLTMGDPEDTWLSILLIVMVVLLFVLLLYFNSQKIIVSEESISSSSILGKRELRMTEILGRRKHRLIATPNSGKKNITCLHNNHLNAYINAAFADLDRIGIATEEKEILADERYGDSELSRKKKLATLRKFTRAFSVVVFGYLALMFLLPLPLRLTLFIGLLSFILIIISIFLFKGHIRLESNSANPALSSAAFATLIILGVPLIRYEPEMYGYFTWAIIFTLCITFIYVTILVGIKNYKFISIWKPFLYFLALAYLGANATNMMLDGSKPQNHDTEVIAMEKKIGGGRYSRTEYVIKIAPWKDMPANQNWIEINQQTYRSIRIGDPIAIEQHKGILKKYWCRAYRNSKELNVDFSLGGLLIR